MVIHNHDVGCQCLFEHGAFAALVQKRTAANAFEGLSSPALTRQLQIEAGFLIATTHASVGRAGVQQAAIVVRVILPAPREVKVGCTGYTAL
ncbi:hypothetical protein D3C76_610920 [compost metagenome]